jgi:O-acetyl-ADP-ribose deacetylase
MLGDELRHANHIGLLLTTLVQATGFSGEVTSSGVAFPSGRAFLPGVNVRFPKDQVTAVERVGMWIDGGDVRLGMWPAELQSQYNRVYSDPAKVEGLIALGDEEGWELNSNFHLGFRFAGPQQRWYPERHLTGRVYVRQWIDDIRFGRAGGRTRQHLQDLSFRRWLLDRGYADDDEISTLDGWLSGLSPGIQFHIRPSIEIVRTWQSKDAPAQGRTGEFVAEVRDATDQVLLALGEPAINALRSRPSVEKQFASSVAARGPRTPERQAAATSERACPTCHLIHAGECDW